MAIYRVQCCNCDMKAKLRTNEETARFAAAKHAEDTGHRTEVRNLLESTVVAVI